MGLKNIETFTKQALRFCRKKDTYYGKGMENFVLSKKYYFCCLFTMDSKSETWWELFKRNKLKNKKFWVWFGTTVVFSLAPYLIRWFAAFFLKGNLDVWKEGDFISACITVLSASAVVMVAKKDTEDTTTLAILAVIVIAILAGILQFCSLLNESFESRKLDKPVSENLLVWGSIVLFVSVCIFNYRLYTFRKEATT